MPGSTPNFALPYPTYTDPTAGSAQIQALAEAIDNANETVAANIAAIGNRTAAYMSSTVAQSIPNASTTTVTYATSTTNGSGLSVNTGTGVMTVNTAGWYMVTSWATFAANSTGNRAINTTRTGSNLRGMRVQANTSPEVVSILASYVGFFAVSDTITTTVSQDSGVALNITNRRMAAAKVA